MSKKCQLAVNFVLYSVWYLWIAVGKFILSGCPAWAGPILFPHWPVIRNGCLKNQGNQQQQCKNMRLLKLVATSQAFNFGLAKWVKLWKNSAKLCWITVTLVAAKFMRQRSFVVQSPKFYFIHNCAKQWNAIRYASLWIYYLCVAISKLYTQSNPLANHKWSKTIRSIRLQFAVWNIGWVMSER